MRIALDTNILAYAEGVNDAGRQGQALRVLSALPVGSLVVPVQVLGELHRVLTGKMNRTASAARTAVMSWRDATELRPTTETALLSAFDLATDHRLSIWDALILSVVAEAECRYLLSEEFQNGFTVRGVTVLDPFRAPIDPRLAALLG
ncbi:MAG: PIN domain-containing protein [Rhodospirillales bacterium]|nr:PIN domain-containing protein [Rhodospirillales bacterium]